MKKVMLSIGLMVALSMVNVCTSQAQSVSVNINIGHQPAWGPAGYNYAGYYYFPDIDIYYDVNHLLFYFFDRGQWRGVRYLPSSYAHYNFYSMYKVVINQPNPWLHNSRYRNEYARYRGVSGQAVILNSTDPRFNGSRNNRVSWVSSNRYDSYPYTNKNTVVVRPDNNYYRPSAPLPHQPVYHNNNVGRVEPRGGNTQNRSVRENRDQQTIEQRNDRQPNNESGRRTY